MSEAVGANHGDSDCVYLCAGSQQMVGPEDCLGWVARGVSEMTSSPDPKTMKCWAIPELSLLFSNSRG